MAILPAQQIGDIERRLTMLERKRPFRTVFCPLMPIGFEYLPDATAADLAALNTDRWQVDFRSGLETADLILVTAHGPNNTETLWRLREANPDAVLGLWLWDNHMAYVANLANTLAADFYFPTHHYISRYLSNPNSARAGTVPACCAQWDSALVRASLAKPTAVRLPRVYAGYVDYEGTPRAAFLQRIRSEVPEVDVRILPRSDRSRYFSKPHAARLDEWLEYPASLVLPVDHDLSTRLFDGLAAGHVLVVADDIADLDQVVTPAEQAALPLLKFRAGDSADLQRAAQEALAHFARDGEEGVRRRQNYALAKHMLAHRVQKMVRTVAAAATGQLRIRFCNGSDKIPGLELRP
ncbi:MAG TPA: glycosyltransferase [Opitutaceae bacterium]|nr:glycosyltransferase [Opitutaceae bacterium]